MEIFTHQSKEDDARKPRKILGSKETDRKGSNISVRTTNAEVNAADAFRFTFILSLNPLCIYWRKTTARELRRRSRVGGHLPGGGAGERDNLGASKSELKGMGWSEGGRVGWVFGGGRALGGGGGR